MMNHCVYPCKEDINILICLIMVSKPFGSSCMISSYIIESRKLLDRYPESKLNFFLIKEFLYSCSTSTRRFSISQFSILSHLDSWVTMNYWVLHIPHVASLVPAVQPHTRPSGLTLLNLGESPVGLFSPIYA